MIKVYDCSNDSRVAHRRCNRGPFTNTVVHALHENASKYGFEFVKQVDQADLIFTNYCYPDSVLKTNKPRIKRMDGVFFTKELKPKNIPLNLAAEQSDHVIFISQFSKVSYVQLYGNQKVIDNSSVVLNTVNNAIFYPREDNKQFMYAAAATNWCRKDKRLASIIDWARNSNFTIILIGECGDLWDLPSNIIPAGYLEREHDIAEILNQSYAFLNFSYKDAAPKVVCQAVQCGLPIIYAASGGTGELVGAGVKLEDNIIDSEISEEEIPLISISEIYCGQTEYLRRRKELGELAFKFSLDNSRSYDTMIEQYFETMRKFV
jgi:glycosyltransferase involved in cell wall biosynthesis